MLSFDPHVKPDSLEDKGVGREGGRFWNVYLPPSARSHAQAMPIFESDASGSLPALALIHGSSSLQTS